MNALTQRVRDLRIGVRLTAAFVLCGVFVAMAVSLSFATQAAADRTQARLDELTRAGQISDELLININDITGWQGLYLCDAVAFGKRSPAN